LIADLPEQAISGPIASAQETWYEYYFNPYSGNYEYVEASAATPRDPTSGALSKEYLDEVFNRIPNNSIFQKQPTRTPLEPPVEQTLPSNPASSFVAALDAVPTVAAGAAALAVAAAAMSLTSGPRKDVAAQPIPGPAPSVPEQTPAQKPNIIIPPPGGSPIENAVNHHDVVQQISHGVSDYGNPIVLRPVYSLHYKKRRKRKGRVAPKTGIPPNHKNKFNLN